MFELALDELERRQRARFEQQAALRRALERLAPLIGRLRRPPRFRVEDALEDWHERVAPAPQRGGVACTELGEGLRGALEIGPPAQRRARGQDERDIELGFHVAGAVPRELELAVPRHLVERAVEERVGVVAVTGPARVFDRREAAADRGGSLEAHGLQAGAPE